VSVVGVEFFVGGKLVEQIAAWLVGMPVAVSLQAHAVVGGVCNASHGLRQLIAIVGDVHNPSAVCGGDLVAFVVCRGRGEG